MKLNPLILPASLLMAGLSSAATTITFESSYTAGALSTLPNVSTSDRPFDGQQGWSRSTSSSGGNIVATSSSGSYVGGQGLTASTTGTNQTYIGAKAVGGFSSYSFDFLYYPAELGIGGWNDADDDTLFDQTEAQFMAGTVTISNVTTFGLRTASFGDRLSTGTSGINNNWYRMTVTPDFDNLEVTLGVFNLTTNTSVTLGTSVFNLSAGQFGVDPTTYDGISARITSETDISTTSGPAVIDNITVIPEPSAALLGSLGMLALLRRRRA